MNVENCCSQTCSHKSTSYLCSNICLFRGTLCFACWIAQSENNGSLIVTRHFPQYFCREGTADSSCANNNRGFGELNNIQQSIDWLILTSKMQFMLRQSALWTIFHYQSFRIYHPNFALSFFLSYSFFYHCHHAQCRDT